MKKLLRILAVAVLGVGLSAGAASAATTSIGPTGPDSSVKVITKHSAYVKVKNNNNVVLSNSSSQSANTGDAKVKHNTTGGNATSGNASNSNALSASLTISNSMPEMDGCGCDGQGGGVGSISNTGPDSEVKVVNKSSNVVKVTNNNSVVVQNSSSQSATSGDAKVSDNTTGGNATSGNASNSNSASFTLNLSN